MGAVNPSVLHPARLWLVAAAASSCSLAQPVHRVIGVPETVHRMEDVVALRNGSLALAGTIYDFAADEQRAAIIRTTADGTPIWEKSFGVSGNYDEAFSLRECASLNLVAAIHSGYDNNALCVVSFSSSGSIVWKKRYAGGGTARGSGMEIETVPPGPGAGEFGLIANGSIADGLAAGQLLRFRTSDGATIFNSSYSADPLLASEVFFTDISTLAGGDYFVTGGITFIDPDTLATDTDVLVARIARSGETVWAAAFGIAPENVQVFEYGLGIKVVPSGVAVLARTSDPPDASGPAAALHLLIDPATGQLFSSSVLPGV